MKPAGFVRVCLCAAVCASGASGASAPIALMCTLLAGCPSSDATSRKLDRPADAPPREGVADARVLFVLGKVDVTPPLGAPFQAKVGHDLIADDALNANTAAKIIVVLRNGHAVRIDDAGALKVRDIVLFGAPETERPVDEQLEALLDDGETVPLDEVRDRAAAWRQMLRAAESAGAETRDESDKTGETKGAMKLSAAQAPPPKPAEAEGSALDESLAQHEADPLRSSNALSGVVISGAGGGGGGGGGAHGGGSGSGSGGDDTESAKSAEKKSADKKPSEANAGNAGDAGGSGAKAKDPNDGRKNRAKAGKEGAAPPPAPPPLDELKKQIEQQGALQTILPSAPVEGAAPAPAPAPASSARVRFGASVNEATPVAASMTAFDPMMQELGRCIAASLPPSLSVSSTATVDLLVEVRGGKVKRVRLAGALPVPLCARTVAVESAAVAVATAIGAGDGWVVVTLPLAR